MKQVKISSKNQITLPSALLKSHNLVPGKNLYIIDSGDEITLSAKNPIERYLEKADRIRAQKKPIGKLIDPLRERQKLRDEWDKR